MDGVIISSLCSLATVIIAIISLTRVYKKDNTNSVRNTVRLEEKVDQVNKGVEEIKLNIKEHNVKLEGVTERLIRVEESTKEAHRRIDEIRNEEKPCNQKNE